MRNGRGRWAGASFFLALLALGVCERPAVGNNNAVFRVSPFNTLDAMRGNKTGVSPQCSAALSRIKPKSNAAARAELFSGRFLETLDMIFSLLPSNIFQLDDKHLVAIGATRFGPFTSLGKPEACRDYYLPGFHYCRMTIFEPVLRVGVCVPRECSAQDVLHGVMPPLQREVILKFVPGTLTGVCGEHHYPASAGTYAMAALILLLVVVAAAGTLLDLGERRRRKLLSGGDPSFLGHGSGDSRARAVLKAFSVVTNWEVLVRPTKHDTFTVLDGMRALTILWVVFGHAFVLMVLLLWVSDNERVVIGPDFGRGFMQRWTSQVLPGAFLSVCVFLFLSAFLGTYHMLHHLTQLRARLPNKGRWAARFLLLETPVVFVHRLIRISPSYYFVLGVYYFIASTLITSTPFAFVQQDLQACRQYWWMNLLYIQNLRAEKMLTSCYLPSWYLAVDTQLFVVLPWLVLIAFWNRWAGITVCVALWVASVVMTDIMANETGWSPVPTDFHDYQRFFDQFYVKPWFRAPAYLMGIVSGIVWVNWGHYYRGLVADTSRRAKNGIWAGLTLAVALTLLGLTVYGSKRCAVVQPCDAPPKEMAVFMSLVWPGFMLGVILILFLCFLGLEGGIITALLSTRPLVLLARLSFCIYLVHFGLMVVVMSSEPGTYPFSEVRFSFDFVGYLAGSTVLALLLHLLVERPSANLEAMLRPKKAKEDGEKGTTVDGAKAAESGGVGYKGPSDGGGDLTAEGKAEP